MLSAGCQWVPHVLTHSQQGLGLQFFACLHPLFWAGWRAALPAHGLSHCCHTDVAEGPTWSQHAFRSEALGALWCIPTWVKEDGISAALLCPCGSSWDAEQCPSSGQALGGLMPGPSQSTHTDQGRCPHQGSIPALGLSWDWIWQPHQCLFV